MSKLLPYRLLVSFLPVAQASCQNSHLVVRSITFFHFS